MLIVSKNDQLLALRKACTFLRATLYMLTALLTELGNTSDITTRDVLQLLDIFIQTCNTITHHGTYFVYRKLKCRQTKH